MHHDSTAINVYVRDLARYPVLSADAQRELATAARDGERPEHEREQARRALIESNLRFAFALAKRYARRGPDLPELVAEANVGLIQAAEHYDPAFGVSFVGYATRWIRHSIVAWLAHQRHSVSLPVRRLADAARLARTAMELRGRYGRAATTRELARETGLSPSIIVSLLRILSGDVSIDQPSIRRDDTDDNRSLEQEPSLLTSLGQAPSGADLVVAGDASAVIEAVRHALSPLVDRERDIVALSFGLGGAEATSTDDIAQRLELSPERVRQLRERALARLRLGPHAERLRALWVD